MSISRSVFGQSVRGGLYWQVSANRCELAFLCNEVLPAGDFILTITVCGCMFRQL